MDRNIVLELVRVTEAAAIAAARWVGRGDQHAADEAAVTAMRKKFSELDFHGKVVIGEGERDKAPMLYIGEEIGNGKGPMWDIAVDPLEGTSITAKGGSNAISVIAAGPKGTLLHAPDCYMDKIAVGPGITGVDLDNTVEQNIKAVAKSLNKPIDEITVIVLDRERHEGLISQIREVGARIILIGDGDVAGAIATAMPETRADILMGIGAAPEGVISACALKCLGGFFQGRLICSHHDGKQCNKEQEARAKKMGISDLSRKYTAEDLAKGDRLIFAATGVTGGQFLKGVTFTPQGARTESVAMRTITRTIRYVHTIHNFSK